MTCGCGFLLPLPQVIMLTFNFIGTVTFWAWLICRKASRLVWKLLKFPFLSALVSMRVLVLSVLTISILLRFFNIVAFATFAFVFRLALVKCRA